MASIVTPAFKAHLRPLPVPGDGALLLSETGGHVLSGRLYAAVVPWIDGRRSAAEIVTALSPALGAAQVWYALMRLEQAGYLVEAQPAIPPGAAAFWSALGRDPQTALAALRAVRVRVSAVDSPLADRFGAALRDCGVTVVADDAAAGLVVVLAANYLSDKLLPLGDAALAAGARLLLVRPSGIEIWIGPLLAPGAAGCLRCLRYRISRNRPAHAFAQRQHAAAGATVPGPSLPVTEEAGCLLAAVEVAKMLGGVDADLSGAVVSLDLRDRSMRTHRLIAYPGCTACGEPRTSDAVPLRLERQLARHDTDSGYRTSAPESTLQRYSHLISPITGIVGSLDSGLPDGLRGVGHAYRAADRVGPSPVHLGQLLKGFRSNSGGKGTTDQQARTSALCEAIERYSALRHHTEVTRLGTYRELGADAIHPNEVMRFSDRQYRERDAWNASQPGRHFVPVPFEPDARIEWVPVWSLTARRQRLLPAGLLFMHDPGSHLYSLACSNGCAAGNTREEAVLQGLFELVERDAVAVWWYNRLSLPAVDITTFGDAWLSNLSDRYAALGRDFVALDLTHDLGIPVMAAVSNLRAGAQEQILIGFGCHLDARTALRRAMLEMCQMLAWSTAADAQRDDNPASELHAWLTHATRANQPYLVPDDTVLARTRGDYPAPPGPDLLAAIDAGRRAIEARGLEMLVLDQTRADAGLPVVKVIVPGLRHFWARFGPGRLYDVPVAMGRLDAPVAEEHLNPIPFFF